MPTDHAAELRRLLTVAHDATRGIPYNRSARQLYLDASTAAEQAIPGPLGTAVAGVLALAAEERRVSGFGGVMGERETTLALALVVLEAAPTEAARA